MTGLNEIENVYGETVEFYDLSALSQIGNKKIVLNKFADMVKDLDGIILDIGAGTGKTTIEMANMICDKEIIALEPSAYMRTAFMASVKSLLLLGLFNSFCQRFYGQIFKNRADRYFAAEGFLYFRDQPCGNQRVSPKAKIIIFNSDIFISK